MNIRTVCIFVFLLAVWGCKKDKNSSNQPKTPIDSPITVTYPDYTLLKPGNYWIYREYTLDSANGAAYALNVYDSFFVEKDTDINGHTYHKYCEPNIGSADYWIHYWRDSLSYIVDANGTIQFSSEDFTDTFRTIYSYPSGAHPDTLRITEQMGFKDAAVTVDAGTFTASAFRQLWHMSPGTSQFGAIREIDRWYAKGIGLVKQNTPFYISIPDMYERRLVRYHLN